MVSRRNLKIIFRFFVVVAERVLSELNLTIVNKCEQYSDLATKHLFRLNNIHYILKSLQRTNLLDLVAFTGPDCERNYQELIQVRIVVGSALKADFVKIRKLLQIHLAGILLKIC